MLSSQVADPEIGNMIDYRLCMAGRPWLTCPPGCGRTGGSLFDRIKWTKKLWVYLKGSFEFLIWQELHPRLDEFHADQLTSIARKDPKK